MRDEKQRFSLRKLSVGLASVLIGITFLENGQAVKADTVNGSSAQTDITVQTTNSEQNTQNSATDSDKGQDNNVSVTNKVETQASEQGKQNVQNNVQNNAEPKAQVDVQNKQGQIQQPAQDTKQINNANVRNVSTPSKASNQAEIASRNADSVSSKADTNTVTTTLNLNKQISALSNVELFENKVLTNNLPAFGSRSLDERAPRTKHTRVGDTRLSDDQLKHIAISNDIKLTYGYDTNHELPNVDTGQPWNNHTIGLSGTAVLDKNDIKKGNDILIGTIQVSNDRYAQDATDGDERKSTNLQNTAGLHAMLVKFHGDVIGHIDFNCHDLNEYDLIMHVTMDKQFATNPNISFDNVFLFQAWHSTDYGIYNQVFRGMKNNDVLKEQLDTGKHKYEYDFNRNGYETHVVNYPAIQARLYGADAYRHYYMYFDRPMVETDSDGQFDRHHIQLKQEWDKVIKVQILNDNHFTDTDFSQFILNHYDLALNAKGDYISGTVSSPWNGYNVETKQLARNLSVKDVLDNTPVGGVGVSRQDDGSVIIGSKLTKDVIDKSAYTDEQIKQLAEDSLEANIGDPDHYDQIVQNTINDYKNNFTPRDYGLLWSGMQGDTSKPIAIQMTDVTPDNYSPYVYNKLATFTGSDGANGGSFNAELYRNATIQYLDDDKNGSLVSTDSIAGLHNQGTDYAVKIPQGYVLGKNANGINYVWSADKKKVTYTFQDDQKLNDANPIVIHLVHNKQPANSGTKGLSVSHTRTIHYVYDNGTQAQPDKVQTVTFTRTATEDMVNHALSNFSDWTADGDYSQIDVPVIHGYTPTQNIVEEQTASPDHNVVITVTYNRNRQNIHVTYTDDTTGQVLDSVEKSGYSGDDSHYTTQDSIAEYVKRGYVLVSDDYPNGDVKFDSDDFTDNQDYHVHLKHGTTDHNLEHTVTRTIHYVYANGQMAKPDYAVSIKFAGVQTTDNVTGQIVSTKWTPESKSFAEVASPLINGYTANRTLLADVEVNPTSDNIVQTVTYNPNKQNIHVVFIDDTTGNTLNRVEKSGYTNTDSGYSTKDDIDSLVARGYKLVSDDTPKDYPTLMFDSDDFSDNQNFTVHVAHDTKENDLTREVTRTIHYVYVGGKPAGQDKTDSVTFNGVETIDKVDDHVISTVWTPENKEFASVTTPTLAGYTPDKFSVDSTTVKPDSDSFAITVTYRPDMQYAKFNYLDDTTGNQLKQEESHGETDTRNNYSTTNLISYYKNKGYDLVSDDTANKVLTFDNDDSTDQVYNIHFVHGTVTITPENPGKPSEKINPQDPSSPVYPDGSNKLTNTVDREIDYIYSDGRTAKPSVKDSITFNNTEKIDKVTGEIISSTWDGPKDFADIQTPVIEGYTPDKTSVENKGINHATPSIKVTVTYSADPQHMKVIYRDLTANSILSQFAKDGVSDENISYNTQQTIDSYLANGYVLSCDDTNGKDLIFDHNDKLDQIYYVDFTHGTHTYNPEKPDAKDKVDKNDYLADYTTTINYVDNSGKTLHPNKLVNDEYKRNLTIDSVTGEIIKRGNWQLNKGYTQVENPVITGYITSNKDVKPVDKQENQVINIVYNKLGQIHSVDNKGNEIAKAFSYTNDPSDPTKVLVTKVPSVDGYEQVTFTVDPTKKPSEDTTVVFNAPATVTVNYIDNNTGKTLKQDTVKGFATHTSDYSTKNEISNLVKQGYILTTDGAPAKITLTEDPQNYNVTFVHGISKVTHDQPVKPDTPINGTDQKMPKGVDEQDLNRNITRTITAIDPHTGSKITKQVVTLYRDATVDNVTGAVTYTDWTKGKWDKFVTPIVAGYTPSQSEVSEVPVTIVTKDSAVTITYTANPQTGKISYVDTDGKEVDSTPLNGKTDEAVSVTPIIPHGWVVIDGQTIPTKVVATPNGIPTVTIKIKHGTIEVTPDKPKTPSDKMPDGDNYPDGVTQADLNRDITRTLNVVDPHTGLHTTVQTAHLTRNAVVDLVTKAITYGKWSAGNWSEFDTPTVAGYTPSIKNVAKSSVDISTKDTTVDITYAPNPQKGKISYVDEDGKEVANTPLIGKTDDDVKVTPVIPHGWVVIDGQTIPSSVKATADGIPTVSIKIKHGELVVTPDKPKTPNDKMPDGDNYPKGVGQDDLNRNVTRTIILHEPQGDKTVSQVAKYTRIATIDLVTGKVTYSDWDAKRGWDEYTPEEVNGYTPSIKSLVAVGKPKNDTKVEINYMAIPTNDDFTPSVPSQPNNVQSNTDNETAPNEPEKLSQSNDKQKLNKKAKKTNKKSVKAVKRNRNGKRLTQIPTRITNNSNARVAENNGNSATIKFYKTAGNMSDNNVKVANNVSQQTGNHFANNSSKLPQTGNNNDTTIALTGMLLASMGIATAIGASHKKKRD